MKITNQIDRQSYKNIYCTCMPNQLSILIWESNINIDLSTNSLITDWSNLNEYKPNPNLA